MLRNYLKIAIRNLLKRKVYSFINIAGLAAGLACFILISLFIGHELSYDRWNPKASRIVRPFAEVNFGGSELEMAVTGVPVGPDVANEMPEVETFCRFRDYGSSLVRAEGDMNQNFVEEDILSVDSTFFELFPLDMINGDTRTCLARPNTMAISKLQAEKYFGSPQEAIGETLVLDNRRQYEVTAVFEDMPTNSHFQAGFLISLTGNREIQNSPPLWAMGNNFHTYILLKENVVYDDFAEKFSAFARTKVAETSKQLLNMSLEELEATGQYARYKPQKMTDIHLYSDLGAELAPNGSIQYIWVFGAIALFVLFIACINFMNLTTARSSHRAKEIGVRKVLGSLRSSLIGQFLSETILMTFIAVILALGIVTLILPWFNNLTAREMNMPWGNPGFWLSLVAGIGIVGLLAGSYPAFFLSAFDALKVLKSQKGAKSSGGRLRSGLVVFQFTTSIVLIIATILVYNQLNYIQNKKLGFQKDQVVIVENTYVLNNQVEVYKQEMLQQPEIKYATVSSYLPVPSSYSNNTFSTSREFRQDNAINMGTWTVDYDYMNTIGIEMTEGRFFDRNFPTDSSGIILNEAALEVLGFEDPIGKKIYQPQNFNGQPNPEDFVELSIIGIVKDFHWESLRQNIAPLSMVLGASTGLMSFKFEAADSRSVISKLESTWNRMAPTQPFSYRFLDESFESMYETEQRIGSIATSFAILAILISFLGLFGLASFTVDQRTKEIGIRKVLGANASNIVSLLSKDYLKLAGIALIFAIPIAYWSMNQWLQDFAYRINISWWVFLLAGLASILIVILSVSFQSVKAALANPVDSLRSE